MKKNKLLLISLLLSVGCTQKEGFTVVSVPSFMKDNLLIEKQEVLNANAAQELLSRKSVVIDDLLEPKYDPYIGEINLPNKCQRKNVPPVTEKKDSSGFMKMFSFYSSKQKIIGHCPGVGQLLKTQYLLIYCRSSQTFIVAKYFYREEDPWIIAPLIKCLPGHNRES